MKEWVIIMSMAAFALTGLCAGHEEPLKPEPVSKSTDQLKAEEKSRADWLEMKWKPAPALDIVSRGAGKGAMLNAVGLIRRHQQWLEQLKGTGIKLSAPTLKTITETTIVDLKYYLPNASASELEKLLETKADKLFTVAP